MPTIRDDARSSHATEPLRCQHTSLVAGERHACDARPVDDSGATLRIEPGEPEPHDAACLAHHSHRSQVMTRQASLGTIDFSAARIDDAVLADLRRCLQNLDPRMTPVVRFDGASLDTATVENITFPAEVSMVAAHFAGEVAGDKKHGMAGLVFHRCQFHSRLNLGPNDPGVAPIMRLTSCQFDDEVYVSASYQQMTIDDCNFKQRTWLMDLVIGEFVVSGTTFGGEVILNQLRCTKARFDRTTFAADATFSDSHFTDAPDFNTVAFTGVTSFRGTAGAIESTWFMLDCHFGPILELPDSQVVLDAARWTTSARSPSAAPG